jgi:hypothetical protein
LWCHIRMAADGIPRVKAFRKIIIWNDVLCSTNWWRNRPLCFLMKI